jgi:hypothetical protein
VPILKPAQSSQRPQRPEPIVAPCHPPRDTYVSEPRDTYVSLEPPNRTTEGTTYVSPTDVGVMDASHLGREEKGDFRDSKVQATPPEVPLNVLRRQCYDLARAHAAEWGRNPVRKRAATIRA